MSIQKTLIWYKSIPVRRKFSLTDNSYTRHFIKKRRRISVLESGFTYEKLKKKL